MLAISFWRGATNLQGHTRAAAQALAELLSRKRARVGRRCGAARSTTSIASSPASARRSPSSCRPTHRAVGKTLAEIKLRGLTGATVLAIQRGDESILVPAGHERLQAGDVLAIAGTHDAVAQPKSYWLLKK